MAYRSTVFEVMIASPGDVEEERSIIREAILEWNVSHSRHASIILKPVGWDTDTYSSLGETGQAQINKQIVKDADVLVAVFWTRIGTPTERADSGTVEEIEEHIGAGKPAMLYFSSFPIDPSRVDPVQFESLKELKGKYRKKGLVFDFNDRDMLRRMFSRQLAKIINDNEYFHRNVVRFWRGISAESAVNDGNNNDPVVPVVHLSASRELLSSLDEFPPEYAMSWRNLAIDGAFEVMTFTKDKNRYGGMEKNDVTVHLTSEEWSSSERLAVLGRESVKKLGNGLLNWLPARRAKPNRVRFLVKCPVQPVLDNSEFSIEIGNSDYFTMRTIADISRRSRADGAGFGLGDIFGSRWVGPSEKFPGNCVPYHLSSQGILFLNDPSTGVRFLVLTLPSLQRNPLVPGWNATFAEQMWAPKPAAKVRPWWAEFTKNLDIESAAERQGDEHIEDTVIRGLWEELGIERKNLIERPALISACIEQDLYFLTFLYVLEISMSLDDLFQRTERSPDREIEFVAAYPIQGLRPGGGQFDPFRQFAELLSDDFFDGGKHIIPRPTNSLVQPWHISSRMRIYAAARHLLGDPFMNYVKVSGT